MKKFDELIEVEARKYSLDNEDSCHMVDFKAGAKFVEQNAAKIPAVAELVEAHRGAITRDINGDTRIDSHAYREILKAIKNLEKEKV